MEILKSILKADEFLALLVFIIEGFIRLFNYNIPAILLLNFFVLYLKITLSFLFFRLNYRQPVSHRFG